MACREVRVVDCQEVLRRWLAGDGVRPIARATGLDRKTVRRFETVALGLGLRPGDPWPEEKVLAAFVSKTKQPRPPAPTGASEKVLLERRVQIQQWLEQEHLLLTKVHEFLARDGITVPYTSLHRFAQKWCDFGKKPSITLRKLEGKPGEFAEVDFGRLGYLQDLASKKPRLVYAFIMVLGYSGSLAWGLESVRCRWDSRPCDACAPRVGERHEWRGRRNKNGVATRSELWMP